MRHPRAMASSGRARSFLTISWSGLISRVGFGAGMSFWPMARSICCICREGSSSSETMQEGLSARRTEARTSLTRSPRVAFSLSSSGLSVFGLASDVGFVFEVFAGGGLVDGLEVDFAVLVDAREDDLVEVVVEDEDFDVFLLVDLEQRRGAQQRFGAAGDVVDALLAFLHARHDFGEAGEAFDLGGLEADEIEQGFTVGEVAVEAFFERAVVFGDELQVVLGLVGGDVLQLGENLLHAGGADAGEDAILLEDFAADV